MKYWILALSLLLFGCGGGDSTDADATKSETVGAEVAETLNEAQDAAEELGEVLEKAKEDLDEAIEDAEGKPDN